MHFVHDTKFFSRRLKLMLIGFAPSRRHLEDSDTLRELRCERILTFAEGFFEFEDVIGYLRSGDTLAVVSLLRLSDDIQEVVHIVHTLQTSQISLYVAGTDINPERSLGKMFIDSCALLAQFFPVESGAARSHARGRGRPPAFSSESQAKVKKLLKSGHHSITEVAALLNVSPATIYRYFPRGSWDDEPPSSA
jgi:DNA invertase Pin-like site-specific DNA recombinase